MVRNFLKRIKDFWEEYFFEFGTTTNWIMVPNDPDQRNWPAVLTFRPRQIIGGQTWSLALVRHIETDPSKRVLVQRNNAVEIQRLEQRIKERDNARNG